MELELQVLKANVRLVLLSKHNGIYLDNLCEEFQCLVERPLNYQKFGFFSLEDFLRTIPDAARLDYSAKDRTIKVFGVVPAKSPRSGAAPTVEVKQEMIDLELEHRAEESRNHDIIMNTSPIVNPRLGTGVSRGLAVNSRNRPGATSSPAVTDNIGTGVRRDLAVNSRSGPGATSSPAVTDNIGTGVRRDLAVNSRNRPGATSSPAVTDNIGTGVRRDLAVHSRSGPGATSSPAVTDNIGTGVRRDLAVNSRNRPGTTSSPAVTDNIGTGVRRDLAVNSWNRPGTTSSPAVTDNIGTGVHRDLAVNSRNRPGTTSSPAVTDNIGTGVRRDLAVNSWNRPGTTSSPAVTDNIGTGVRRDLAVNSWNRPGTTSSPAVTDNIGTGVRRDLAVNPTVGAVGSTKRRLGANTAVPSDSLTGTGADMAAGESSRIGTDGEPVFTPDHKGLYSLCFPARHKPDMVGTLEDLFSMAGKVAEVRESPNNIFVRYHDVKSASRAYKMFQHLGIKTVGPRPFTSAPAASISPQRAQKQDKRNMTGSISDTAEFQQHHHGKKRKMFKDDGPTYRVYVGNLDPTMKYTFPMFHELFKGYTVLWVTMKPSVCEGVPKLCAYVLVPNLQQAESITAEYNGVEWRGREIVAHVKAKQKDKLNSPEFHNANDSFLDLMDTSDMPGLEPLVPRLERGMPGLEPLVPRLERGIPRLEPGMPGLEPDMPGLEPSMPGLEPSMPGLEPSMPGLEPLPGLPNFRVRRSTDSSPPGDIPTILVTNFLDIVTEEELFSLFKPYGAKSVNVLPTQQGRKKAYIVLGSIDDVKRAIKERNQVSFKQGLKMKVDVPFNMPRLREAVFGPEDAQPPVPSTGALTVSQILKVRGNCLQILQTPPLALNLGDQLKVLITTVISDRFFWGQIEDMHSMEQLQRISERLNVPREHREMATGPGRCAALFQGDGNWYRAWAIQGGAEHGNVRVFYLDYGNTDVIPWDHTAKNSERQVWDLQPMAVPFTLAEPVTNLNSRELTQLMVEVNAIGCLEEGNMVVVRATSLIPDLKDSMSCVGRTVIM